jgi:hypothetical protein
MEKELQEQRVSPTHQRGINEYLLDHQDDIILPSGCIHRNSKRDYQNDFSDQAGRGDVV